MQLGFVSSHLSCGGVSVTQVRKRQREIESKLHLSHLTACAAIAGSLDAAAHVGSPAVGFGLLDGSFYAFHDSAGDVEIYRVRGLMGTCYEFPTATTLLSVPTWHGRGRASPQGSTLYRHYFLTLMRLRCMPCWKSSSSSTSSILCLSHLQAEAKRFQLSPFQPIIVSHPFALITSIQNTLRSLSI